MIQVDRRPAVRPAPGRQRLPAVRFSSRTAGYTLLELMVVIMLLSFLLGFAVPAFQKGGETDSLEGAARSLRHAVGKLKAAALSRQQIHKLHLDMDANRIWVTRGGEDSEDEASTRQPALTLSDDIQIASVQFPDNRDVRSGTAEIVFYPQGYSDRAIVKLSDDGDTSTDLIIEAFLPMALMGSDNEETAF